MRQVLKQFNDGWSDSVATPQDECGSNCLDDHNFGSTLNARPIGLLWRAGLSRSPQRSQFAARQRYIEEVVGSPTFGSVSASGWLCGLNFQSRRVGPGVSYCVQTRELALVNSDSLTPATIVHFRLVDRKFPNFAQSMPHLLLNKLKHLLRHAVLKLLAPVLGNLALVVQAHHHQPR